MNATDERPIHERNKASYLAAKAAFNARELDQCLAFYAREHQIMSRPAPPGREQLRAFLEGTLAGWPDLRLEVAQVVAEDDWVMGRSVATATHTTAVPCAVSDRQSDAFSSATSSTVPMPAV